MAKSIFGKNQNTRLRNSIIALSCGVFMNVYAKDPIMRQISQYVIALAADDLEHLDINPSKIHAAINATEKMFKEKIAELEKQAGTAGGKKVNSDQG